MSREAIENMVRDMRHKEDMPLDGYSQLEAYQMMQSLADRVEANVSDIIAENARLKAALKPVLEVGWVEKRYNYCSGTVPTKDLYLVVREAQEIYNGGAK